VVQNGVNYQGKDLCYYGLATGWLKNPPIVTNVSYCSKIQSESIKDECYEEIGWVERSSDYCNLIQDQDRKGLCLKRVGKFDPEKGCSSQKDQLIKDACYFNAAKLELTSELRLCKLIINPNLKESCYIQTLVYFDGTPLPARLCNQLADPDAISRCSSIVSEADKLLVHSRCYQIRDNNNEKLACYEAVIKEAKQSF
jgi:hypothetical protein